MRYLEARLIDMTKAAGRVSLANTQMPEANRRRLPEADKANMEAFLANLKVVLPVIGLDLLKPRLQAVTKNTVAAVSSRGVLTTEGIEPHFEIRHASGVKAFAVEEEGEFVVLKESEALKDTGYAHNSYVTLKQELIADGILKPSSDGKRYDFTHAYAFRSPSAAGSVILDRNINGRTCWYRVGSKLNYHEWQEGKSPVQEG